MSRLCLIPLAASAAEVWSTADLMKTIAEAKQFSPTVDARLVWTRFRSYTREAQELSTAVGKELGLTELATKIGYRVSYSEALARGLTVSEWPDRAAREEMARLVDEVRTIMGEGTP
jgi:chromosome partitioning protein